MYLRLLEKIHRSDKEFTQGELKTLAPYAPHFVWKENYELAEALYKHLPGDARQNLMNAIFAQGCGSRNSDKFDRAMKIALESGDKEMLKNMFRVDTGWHVSRVFHGGHIQQMEHIVRAAYACGGKEFITEMLVEKFPCVKIARRFGQGEVLDKLYTLAKELDLTHIRLKLLTENVYDWEGKRLPGFPAHKTDTKLPPPPPEPQVPAQEVQDPFSTAIASGNAEVVGATLQQWRQQGETVMVERIKRDHYQPITLAREKGQVHIVNLLLESLPAPEKEQAFATLPARWREALKSDLKKDMLWQQIGGGAARWREVTNHDAPDVSLAEQSPYRFKQKLYEEILPLMKLAGEMENNQGNAALQAYKLSVLFPNKAEIDRYLGLCAGQWRQNNDPSNPGRRVVHDACLFHIPRQGKWTPAKWKDLVLKYGPAVSKFLGRAADFEGYLGKIGEELPKTPEAFEKLSKTMVYSRAMENPDFARMAAEHGLAEEAFDRCLDILERQKTKDFLPPVMIDGADIGHPNFYMVKLEAGDPRGLILGEITNCCQSIGGAGEKYAEHGATSENGGFYVWKHKTNGQMTADDPIFAQSWVWLGTNNEVVFDSYERLADEYDKLAQPFLEQFSFVAAKDHGIREVRLGQAGNTPNLALPLATDAAKPKDFKGVPEALKQYVITAKDHRIKPPETAQALG